MNKVLFAALSLAGAAAVVGFSLFLGLCFYALETDGADSVLAGVEAVNVGFFIYLATTVLVAVLCKQRGPLKLVVFFLIPALIFYLWPQVKVGISIGVLFAVAALLIYCAGKKRRLGRRDF